MRFNKTAIDVDLVVEAGRRRGGSPWLLVLVFAHKPNRGVTHHSLFIETRPDSPGEPVCVCICPIMATRKPVCLILLFHTKMTLQFVHFVATLLKIRHLSPDKAQTLLLAWRVFPSSA